MSQNNSPAANVPVVRRQPTIEETDYLLTILDSIKGYYKDTPLWTGGRVDALQESLKAGPGSTVHAIKRQATVEETQYLLRLINGMKEKYFASVKRSISQDVNTQQAAAVADIYWKAEDAARAAEKDLHDLKYSLAIPPGSTVPVPFMAEKKIENYEDKELQEEIGSYEHRLNALKEEREIRIERSNLLFSQTQKEQRAQMQLLEDELALISAEENRLKAQREEEEKTLEAQRRKIEDRQRALGVLSWEDAHDKAVEVVKERKRQRGVEGRNELEQAKKQKL